MKWDKIRCEYGPVLFAIVLLIVLLLLPTGYERMEAYQEAERVKAKVLAVDDGNIIDNGLIRTGEQTCIVKILEGIFVDEVTIATNRLSGSLAQDKQFSRGDVAYVVISYSNENISAVTMTDYYRLDKEMALLLLFALSLVIFAGKTGLRALLSFVDSVLIVWKLLVPFMLKGWDPIYLTMGLVVLMTVVLLSLIYGFDRRCLAAALGAISGIVVTAVLGIIFTNSMKIHGAVMEASESLLYAGYQHLNLTKIFMASVFLGASGAVVDLSVDICTAVYEVIRKKDGIAVKEAIASGLNMGRNACGSMITTLLLAYSGSYITFLMVFMAQGTPVEFMINYKYMAAEVVHTVAGSFGLITVAPFTAITSGILLTENEV